MGRKPQAWLSWKNAAPDYDIGHLALNPPLDYYCLAHGQRSESWDFLDAKEAPHSPELSTSQHDKGIAEYIHAYFSDSTCNGDYLPLEFLVGFPLVILVLRKQLD